MNQDCGNSCKNEHTTGTGHTTGAGHTTGTGSTTVAGHTTGTGQTTGTGAIVPYTAGLNVFWSWAFFALRTLGPELGGRVGKGPGGEGT